MVSKEEQRRAWTRNQMIAMLGLVTTFLTMVAGVIVGFTELGKDVEQLKLKTAKLEMQTPIIIEVRTLVTVFKDSMAEFKQSMVENRQNWQILVKKSDEADQEIIKKIQMLEIAQNEIKNKLERNQASGRGLKKTMIQEAHK